MNRRLARESVLTTLYQLEFQPDEQSQIIHRQRTKLDRKTFLFYQQIVNGIQQHLNEIDQVIGKCLKSGWSIDRIASIDRAILRIAFYELLYEQETPIKVVINEAVEIAKSYSGDEASRFINGCLGKWVRENQEGQVTD
ncbi:NusB antitermination factor [Seinonella peptonophila]|uniref:Transcription antitermination protein NusB n=1 Tax=Seinonella peptonophila TaxID=112248 RepID=A0A1M4TM53_9BACL|nr:transcription antitermination factor NusB [Seinonella peptonophila]SHE45563.1 NusB antitermination factor [Seinonella peptonophila]